jgi:hypothetical protein
MNRNVLKRIPANYPVQPLKAGDEAKCAATCGTCGLSWDDGVSTSLTPTPSARCPFEGFHTPTRTHTRRKPLSFHVIRGDEPKGLVWEKTTRYSKVGCLVITRAISDDPGPFVITHAMSGMRVAKFPKLAQARAALAMLLPLADWRQEAEWYRKNGLRLNLGTKVCEVAQSVSGLTTK